MSTQIDLLRVDKDVPGEGLKISRCGYKCANTRTITFEALWTDEPENILGALPIYIYLDRECVGCIDPPEASKPLVQLSLELPGFPAIVNYDSIGEAKRAARRWLVTYMQRDPSQRALF